MSNSIIALVVGSLRLPNGVLYGDALETYLNNYNDGNKFKCFVTVDDIFDSYRNDLVLYDKIFIMESSAYTDDSSYVKALQKLYAFCQASSPNSSVILMTLSRTNPVRVDQFNSVFKLNKYAVAQLTESEKGLVVGDIRDFANMTSVDIRRRYPKLNKVGITVDDGLSISSLVADGKSEAAGSEGARDGGSGAGAGASTKSATSAQAGSSNRTNRGGFSLSAEDVGGVTGWLSDDEVEDEEEEEEPAVPSNQPQEEEDIPSASSMVAEEDLPDQAAGIPANGYAQPTPNSGYAQLTPNSGYAQAPVNGYSEAPSRPAPQYGVPVDQPGYEYGEPLVTTHEIIDISGIESNLPRPISNVVLMFSPNGSELANLAASKLGLHNYNVGKTTCIVDLQSDHDIMSCIEDDVNVSAGLPMWSIGTSTPYTDNDIAFIGEGRGSEVGIQTIQQVCRFMPAWVKAFDTVVLLASLDTLRVIAENLDVDSVISISVVVGSDKESLREAILKLSTGDFVPDEVAYQFSETGGLVYAGARWEHPQHVPELVYDRVNWFAQG